MRLTRGKRRATAFKSSFCIEAAVREGVGEGVGEGRVVEEVVVVEEMGGVAVE